MEDVAHYSCIQMFNSTQASVPISQLGDRAVVANGKHLVPVVIGITLTSQWARSVCYQQSELCTGKVPSKLVA